MPTSQPKLIARNVAAVRRFADPSNLLSITAGNPASTRLESGIGNCFPGLECDLRNLERRFFPFLEMDPIDNFIFLASVDTDGVAHAQAAGDLSQADASLYAALADDLKAGRSVLVSRITGTFGVLGSHSESDYLRAVAPPRAPAGNPEDATLQTAYASLLNNLYIGYKKGRFLGANEINMARASMVGSDGIVAKAEGVARQNFLITFATPADARFAPIDPPGLLIA